MGPTSLQFCGFSVGGPSLSNPHHGVAVLCWGLNRKDMEGEGDSPLDPAPTELLATAAHPSGQLGWGHPEGSGTVP